MGKAPAYQMYAQDFDMDTASWSNDEVGIYTRLLNYEWVNGSIPSDLGEIARIVREPYSPRFHAKFTVLIMRKVFAKFTPNHNGNLVNKKMEEVRQNQLKYSESRRKNVSIRYKDKPTYVDTHEEHMELHTPLSSSSSSSSSSKKNKTYNELFLNFWDQYPNKKGKEEAFKAWKKHNPNMEVVINAVKAQKEEKANLTLDGKFCPEWPNASTWLNNKRWEDETNGTSDIGPLERIRRAREEEARRRVASSSNEATDGN